MKKTIVLCLIMTAAFIPVSAQTNGNTGQAGGKGSLTDVDRKFEILVRVHDGNDNDALTKFNADVEAGKRKRDAAADTSSTERGLLSILHAGFGSSLVSKTASASSGVMSLIVNAIKSKREKWMQTAQQQCTFTKNLSSQSRIDDFYYLPSTNGAMDPANIKFKGFGCRNYLECKDTVHNKGQGKDVFKVVCSMRSDSIGVARIVNHSKFEMVVDTLIFNPFYCDLPNDSLKTKTMFDYRKRTDLTFTLNVKIYSSWINEAIMITTDQLLGEFNVTAKIDEKDLNQDSLFVYIKGAGDDKAGRVSVTGDCFIVPRSFVGTINGKDYQPTWGTGEYRLEMTVTETCQMNIDYYCETDDDGDSMTSRKWDKDKWKKEWKSMQENKNDTFFGQVWGEIVTAYKGSNWVETFTDPLSTAIYDFETEELNNWLNIEDEEEKEKPNF